MLAKERGRKMKKQIGFRLTAEALQWIDDEAKRQGISKNDVIQLLINKQINNEKKTQA